MSLWDFTKSVGRDLFTNEEKAGESIREHILAKNPGVENLEVTYEDQTAYLSGIFDDREAMEKAVLMAGNVKKVKRVDVMKVGFKIAKLAPREPGPLDVADALDSSALDDTVVSSKTTVTPASGGNGSDIIQSEAIPADEITHYVTDGELVDVRSSTDLEDPTVNYYEIKSGDSLSKIAKEFYGDAMKYKALFAANLEVIEDPDKIYPGQKIRIPALD